MVFEALIAKNVSGILWVDPIKIGLLIPYQCDLVSDFTPYENIIFDY